MKKSITILVLAVVLIAGGWYVFSQRSSKSGTPAPAPSTSVQGSLLSTANTPELGTFLVAPNGMTLYLYTKDTPGVTNCYDQCAVNWPPYMVSASTPLKAAAPITGAIATTTRNDGTLQLTYNGIPLYYWIKDAKPGDTTGQNVGGVWFVVKP